MRMASTLLAHRRGILAWYDSHISTGKVEGINNKINVMHTDSGITGISLSGFMPYMTVASLEMSDESEFCAIQPEFIVKPLFLILRNFAAEF